MHLDSSPDVKPNGSFVTKAAYTKSFIYGLNIENLRFIASLRLGGTVLRQSRLRLSVSASRTGFARQYERNT